MKRLLTACAAVLFAVLLVIPAAAAELAGLPQRLKDSVPLPDAVETVFSSLASYVSRFLPAVLILGAVLCLLWCFFGFRLRRLRYALLMLATGALGGWIVSTLALTAPAAWQILLISLGSGVVLGCLGWFLWPGAAALFYAAAAGSGAWILLLPAEELLLPVRLVICGLVAVTVAVLLLLILRPSEIVLTGLHGFLGVFLVLEALRLWRVPVDRLETWAYLLLLLGSGLLLSAGGIVVQFLFTKNPWKERRELKRARRAIAQSAAVDINAPAEPEAPAQPEAPTQPETPTQPEAPAQPEVALPAAEPLTLHPLDAPAAPAMVESAAPAGDVLCPACGKANEPGSRFCMECGHALNG